MVNSRHKGKKTENQLANKLRPIWPKIKRNLAQTYKGGVDFVNSGCFAIEAKSRKTDIVTIRKWLDQLNEEANPTDIKCLHFRANCKPGYWVIQDDDFMEILLMLKNEGVI